MYKRVRHASQATRAGFGTSVCPRDWSLCRTVTATLWGQPAHALFEDPPCTASLRVASLPPFCPAALTCSLSLGVTHGCFPDMTTEVRHAAHEAGTRTLWPLWSRFAGSCVKAITQINGGARSPTHTLATSVLVQHSTVLHTPRPSKRLLSCTPALTAQPVLHLPEVPPCDRRDETPGASQGRTQLSTTRR